MVKVKKILNALFFAFISYTAVAQEKIDAVYPCVDSIIDTLKTNTTYQPVNVIIKKKKVVLRNDKEQYEFKQRKIISWIDKIEKDSIKAYEISDFESTCYVLYSSVKQATGLAINFTCWLIIIPKSNFVVDFESLSQNPRLIYFDQSTRKLNFIRFTYGEHFFWKRDWNNIDFRFEQSEVENNKINLVIIKNTMCSENLNY